MAEELKTKGNEAFKAKKFNEAIECFSKAIELDPSNQVLYSNRSACYASLEQWDKCFSDAEKCVELKPTWSKAYTRLGAAQFGKGEHAEAIKSYEKGLELDPENQTIKDSISDVRKALAEQTTNPFAKIFGRDTISRIQQNPKLSHYLADPTYVQMINMIISNPNSMQQFLQDPRIQTTMIELMGLSSHLQRESEPRRAPSPPRKTEPAPASLQPAEPSIIAKDKGNAHYKKREFELALAAYDEAISLDSSNGSFYLNKSSVYYEMKNWELCENIVNEALELYENGTLKQDYVVLAKLLTRKAQIFQVRKEYIEAIALYKKALIEHRNANTLNLLNACEGEKKKWDQEMYYDVDLSQQAKERGNDCFREQKYPEAISEYSEAIKRNPKDHVLYSNRAAAYMKLGAYDDAVKDCEKSLELDENFVKAIVRMAHCYFFRKEYHRALQFYERGMKVDPSNQECMEGASRTKSKISESMYNGEVDEERIARAKNDPEIREILADTYMQFVLREMSMDPTRAEEYLSDPNIAVKIQKLIAAGILSFDGKNSQGRKK